MLHDSQLWLAHMRGAFPVLLPPLIGMPTAPKLPAVGMLSNRQKDAFVQYVKCIYIVTDHNASFLAHWVKSLTRVELGSTNLQDTIGHIYGIEKSMRGTLQGLTAYQGQIRADSAKQNAVLLREHAQDSLTIRHNLSV